MNSFLNTQIHTEVAAQRRTHLADAGCRSRLTRRHRFSAASAVRAPRSGALITFPTSAVTAGEHASVRVA